MTSFNGQVKMKWSCTPFSPYAFMQCTESTFLLTPFLHERKWLSHTFGLISFNLPCTEGVSVSVLACNCPVRDRNENRHYGFQRVTDCNFMDVIYFFRFEMT